jgi:hypothetical protein
MFGRARIESIQGGTVQIAQSDVARHVANRIRRNLRGPQTMKETHRRNSGEQRYGSRVVSVENRLRAVRCYDLMQPLRYFAERGFPGDGFEASLALGACAPQGLGQPTFWVAPFAVVSGGALSAQGTATDGVSRVAANRGHHPAALMHPHAAGIVAITWTGREYYFVARIGGCHGVPVADSFLQKSPPTLSFRMRPSVREPPQTEYCWPLPGISPPPPGILSE